jgi:hypothetical protein
VYVDLVTLRTMKRLAITIENSNILPSIALFILKIPERKAKTDTTKTITPIIRDLVFFFRIINLFTSKPA